MVDIWKGTHWFIEGDISDCFGSLDHEVMLATLAEKIHDGRFLQLVSRMLKAGYLEDWIWHVTLGGSPQGGIATPPTQQQTIAHVTLRVGGFVVGAAAGRGFADGDAVADSEFLGSDEDVLDECAQDPLFVLDGGGVLLEPATADPPLRDLLPG